MRRHTTKALCIFSLCLGLLAATPALAGEAGDDTDGSILSTLIEAVEEIGGLIIDGG